MKNYVSPVVSNRIMLVGALIDFALNYFVFKEPLGRWQHSWQLVLV